jgi:hypothetical protein
MRIKETKENNINNGVTTRHKNNRAENRTMGLTPLWWLAIAGFTIHKRRTQVYMSSVGGGLARRHNGLGFRDGFACCIVLA